MTTTLRRTLVLAALAACLMLVAGPAMAAPSHTAPVTAELAAQSDPYIEVDGAEDEPAEPQWTYRFLVPTSIALTVLLVIGTVVGYFVRVVRARYTVVE